MNFRKILLYPCSPRPFTPGAGALNNYRHNHTAFPAARRQHPYHRRGFNTATVTDSVEMYNMSTNLYEAWAGNLATARSSHTATLMSDGRVLIAGVQRHRPAHPVADAFEICNPTT